MARNRTPIYRPGETVPVSGQYAIVDRNGRYLGIEITCVKGEPFPPTSSINQYGYVLRDAGSGIARQQGRRGSASTARRPRGIDRPGLGASS